MYLELPAGVVHEVPLSQLSQNSDPDLSVQRDLVAEAHSLETSGPLDRIPASEKSRVGLADPFGNRDRIELNFENSQSGGATSDWVADVQHVKAEVDLVDLEDEVDGITNLTLGLNLPITTIQIR